jgi:hypothetical protein
MQRLQDELTALRALAECHPSLRELRQAKPSGSEGFLSFAQNKSENWPTLALVPEYGKTCASFDAKPE